MPIDPFESPMNLKLGVVLRTTGDFVFLNNPGVIIKKDAGAPTRVTLPKNPRLWQMVFVKDGRGDAATNNITIVGADGELIDGESSLVIEDDYVSVLLGFDEDQWGTLASSVAAAAPTIFGFSPTLATASMTVIITGTHLAGATAVKFNGVPAQYWIVSATQITAIVPVTMTGPVTVETPGGTAIGGSLAYFAGPLSMTSTAQWLKADGANFQDSARTVADNIVNSPVGSATDFSGNSKHSSAALTVRPTYQTPIDFNASAFVFDGINDCIQSPINVLGAAVAGLTVAFAGRFRSTTGNDKYIFGASKSLIYNGTDHFVLFEIIKAAGQFVAYQVTVRKLGAAVIVTTNIGLPSIVDFSPHVWLIRFTAGGTLELWMDGALLISGSAAAVGAVDLSNKVEDGGVVGGAVATDWDLHERPLHEYAGTDAQIACEQAYLAYKWKIWPRTAFLTVTGPLPNIGGFLTKLASGRILLNFGTGSSDGSNDTSWNVRYTDDRVTWSTPVLIRPGGGVASIMTRASIELPNGKIVQGWYQFPGNIGYSSVSTDGGFSYVDHAVASPAGYAQTILYSRIIRKANGALLCAAESMLIATGHFSTLLLQSIDEGVSWTLVGVIATEGNPGSGGDYSEAAIEFQADENHIFAVVRHDNGATRTTEVFTSANGGANFSGGAEFQAGEYYVEMGLWYLADGLLVFGAGKRTSQSTATLLRSLDNGATWSNYAPLSTIGVTSNTAPSIVELLPGQLMVSWSEGGATGNATMNIQQLGESFIG